MTERAETDALRPAREQDAIQVVVAWPQHITALLRWLNARGLDLFPIPMPDTADDLPSYGVGPLRTPPAATPKEA